MRILLLFLLTAALLFGKNLKLYLKDGSYHLVSQYQVIGDRVRFYSTERSEWEEMPVSLVDLAKTEAEQKARQAEVHREAKEADEEEAAERAVRREIEAIPMNSGAYYKDSSGQIKALPSADYQVITDKKRKTLKYLSPIPLVPGKASVVIKGTHSNFVVHEERPEFYLRLDKEERFGIVRLTPKKDVRVVENISISPIDKSNYEERDQMDTFDQELNGNLYKVWPEKPLTPGEYALVEFTEGDVDLIVWDFAYKPSS